MRAFTSLLVLLPLLACSVPSRATPASPTPASPTPEAPTPAAPTPAAPPPCSPATLPAYAHNDYENARPLLDALALGFRGVEVDLYLINDTLRVGHDRGRAARGPAFEQSYLAPLQARVAECTRLTDVDVPFFLAVELKESSPQTLLALRTVLEQYAGLFSAPTTAADTRTAPIEVVLVGWHPPVHEMNSLSPRVTLSVQHRLSSDRARVRTLHPRERLLSLDYGKTIGRWWRTAASRQRWLEMLRAARLDAPDRLIRVHNVPADPRVYASLRQVGVDLIGTKDLVKTHQLLQPGVVP